MQPIYFRIQRGRDPVVYEETCVRVWQGYRVAYR